MVPLRHGRLSERCIRDPSEDLQGALPKGPEVLHTGPLESRCPRCPHQVPVLVVLPRLCPRRRTAHRPPPAQLTTETVPRSAGVLPVSHCRPTRDIDQDLLTHCHPDGSGQIHSGVAPSEDSYLDLHAQPRETLSNTGDVGRVPPAVHNVVSPVVGERRRATSRTPSLTA
jgi:hypothetical protein